MGAGRGDETDISEIKTDIIIYIFYGNAHMCGAGDPVFPEQQGNFIFCAVAAGAQGAGKCG